MFCPKCATQNIDGAHFCRACGANLSLIPHALSGQLPTASPIINERLSRRLRRRSQPSMEEGVRNVVMGLGFVTVAVSIGLFGGEIGGRVWWFWLLIPAFGMLSRGIAEIMRVNRSKDLPAAPPQQFPYAAPPQNLPPNTNELRPPMASVTEGTTRLLDHDSTRPYEPLEERKPS